MKAVIPVAGAGTNLRPHTHTQPKPMIPVAGKPILGHIIESLLAAGIREQVFIIGYLGNKIREYVEQTYAGQIEATFVVQEPRKGLAHALWVAREALSGEKDFLIVLGDSIFLSDLPNILQVNGNALGVQAVEVPRHFGVAMLGKDGLIARLEERPDIPKSNLALVGMYKMGDIPVLYEVLEAMMKEPPSEPVGEYFLTTAINGMIARGIAFHPYMVESWHDCGRKKTLLVTNRIMLEEIRPPVVYQYPGSVIIPPVHIAPGCVIEHAIIGPYVAIAENAVIRNSIVRNSIIGAYAHLDNIVLRTSVVGNDTSIRGRANSVNIGDNTEIDFEE